MAVAPIPSEPSPDDPFFAAYDRQTPAYGWQPSAELAAVLSQCGLQGRALDLGAGAGRDSLAMAAAGLQVTSVDRSRRGLERLMQRAAEVGLADRIETQVVDLRRLVIAPGAYQLITAVTVLDHLAPDDAAGLWQAMVQGLDAGGAMYVQVHTTDDPGSPVPWGACSNAPVSETASQVVNYFPPGRLMQMAMRSELRVLRYEERFEWDVTHGPEHLHGKAVLLAARTDRPPLPWYGFPPVFPRT